MRLPHDTRADFHWKSPLRSRVAPQIGIAIAGLALLSCAATTAYFIRSLVQPATAQSGARLAATMPDEIQAGNLLRGPLRAVETSALAPKRPVIDRIKFESSAPTLVTGRAQPLATVTLTVGGAVIATAPVNSDGSWAMSIERGLGVGDHRLQVRALQFEPAEPISGDSIRLSLPRVYTSPLEVVVAVADSASDTSAKRPSPIVRIAQAQTDSAKSGNPAAGPLDAVRDWVAKSEKSYQDIGVNGLSVSTPAAAQPAPASGAAPPARPPAKAPPATPGSASIVDNVFDWFKRASDSYQATVTQTLTSRPAQPPVATAQRKIEEAPKQPTVQPPSLPKAEPPREPTSAAEEARKATEAKAKAQEQLKTAQAEREAELKAAEARRKAAEASASAAADQQRAAEDKRIADERKRQSDLKAAEDARLAEAARAAAQQTEAARKLAQETEARRLADLEAKRTADAKALEDARLAEAARLAAQQAEAGKLQAEASKRSAEEAEAKRTAEVEAKRQSEARAADQARQAAAVKAAQEAKAARDASAAIAAKAAQQAKADQEAEARRVADVKRRAMELAEAARGIVVPGTPESNKAPLPPLPSVSTRPGPAPIPEPAPSPRRQNAAIQSPPAAALTNDQLPPLPSVSTRPPLPASPLPQSVARAVAPAPQARGSTPFDRSSRSSLGLSVPVRSFTAKPVSTAVRHSSACRSAGRRISPPGHYVVETGDTLWDIADKHYNDASKVYLLERANNLDGDDLIQPCQRVYVPALKSG